MARICNAERVRFGVASGHERKTLSLSKAERFSGVSERRLKTCPIKAQSTAMA
jgi:hypothetical protein